MIDWTDLSAMLRDLSRSLPIALLCAFLTFAAGVVIGLLARDRINEENEGDARDSMQSPPLLWGRNRLTPTEQLTTPTPLDQWQDTYTPRPRVRAIGADLKPSYDGRKVPPAKP